MEPGQLIVMACNYEQVWITPCSDLFLTGACGVNPLGVMIGMTAPQAPDFLIT